MADIPALNVHATDIAWRPTAAYVARSRLRRFMAGVNVDSYDDLITWAAHNPAPFWDAVVRDLDLQFYREYTTTLDLSRGLPWARWFDGGLYNYAHDAVDKRAAGANGSRIAIRWEGEEGRVRTLSYADLHAESNRMANALHARGIGKGDRIGVFMPMIPETVVTVLALAKIGAVFTPIFSGYGAPAVASRLVDCGATALVTADGFFRRGRLIEMKQVADDALTRVAGVRSVVVVQRTGAKIAWDDDRDVWWHDLTAGCPADFETERMSPEDPYMIIFTSGTTGRPKGVVHVHAGFPVKGAQDLAHCFDVQEDDVLFWLTDLGWMMGPWAISGALMLGATLMLYDGTPDYPSPDRMWSLVERHGVTVLGMAPTVVRAMKGHGTDVIHAHDLSTLRVLGSTGEPWDPESWRWFFEAVGGSRCPIINYSGGTEIAGGIVGCTTITPLKPGCFAGPVPGMNVDVVDELGVPVRGRVGELVVRGPWPGMARGFWHDPDRYIETYWSRLPDTWVHGDWAEIDDDGFWYIRGRSDDTIKVAGKRVGPSEVESAVLAHPAVISAAAIGTPHVVKGEAVVVFVVLRPGQLESEDLREALAGAVARELGKALRPHSVLFVDDLPRTRNAKILRRIIRARHLGQPPGDTSSLENPEALNAIDRAR